MNQLFEIVNPPEMRNTLINDKNLILTLHNLSDEKIIFSTIDGIQLYSYDNQIDDEMLAVFYDISQRTIFGWFDRRNYDTPFWDYGGEAVSTICVDEVNNCYRGVEVNCFAQGMFSAKFEGYDTGIKIVEEWKKSQYNVEPSSGTIYWFTEGYNYWIDHSNENQ